MSGRKSKLFDALEECSACSHAQRKEKQRSDALSSKVMNGSPADDATRQIDGTERRRRRFRAQSVVMAPGARALVQHALRKSIINSN